MTGGPDANGDSLSLDWPPVVCTCRNCGAQAGRVKVSGERTVRRPLPRHQQGVQAASSIEIGQSVHDATVEREQCRCRAGCEKDDARLRKDAERLETKRQRRLHRRQLR